MINIDVKNRFDLFSKFTEIMNNVYENRKEEKKQSYNQNMIKTYLIEGHVSEKELVQHDDFNKFFIEKSKDTNLNIDILETQEDNFFKLIINGIEFFLDATLDKRFWFLHTACKSENTDNKVYKLTKELPSLDNIWLTRKLLEETQNYSVWRGISLRHNEILANKKSEDYDPESINFKVNGATQKKVMDFINLLRKDSEFNYTTGISIINVSSQSSDTDRVLDDIRYDGKFSTRGKSFNRHIWLMNKVYDEYKSKIINIEENYAINYSDNGLEGLPINIEFNRKDLKAEDIIKIIFSFKKPFNLWGYPKKISDGYYKVFAVDLHNGNSGKKINFEISSNFITIYLPKGNCGNTIARLICNIQLHLDSMIKVWSGDDSNELF